jgi:hypothetical protein
MKEKENIISEEDAAVIEEMQQAKAAPEPGMAGLKAGVEDSGRDLPIDGRPQIKWIGSAGYVYVWDNRTGERSTINSNMLKTQLGKKRPDGSRVFTTIDPKIPVKRGNLKCMLHAKDPNRAHYDELGLPVCRKDNLTSVYQVKRHMQKRHPQEWATIQEEITRKEKEEDMELRRAVLQSAGKAKSKEA